MLQVLKEQVNVIMYLLRLSCIQPEVSDEGYCCVT